jgi:hypothetical protein
MQAIDTMAEMIETRLPLFTSNIVKVKTLISFVFLSISICHFQSNLLFIKAHDFHSGKCSAEKI